MKFDDDEKDLLLKGLGALMGKTIMIQNDYDDYEEYRLEFYDVYGLIKQCRKLIKKIEENENE